jgi:predicted protein tyrosine phosphatase
MKNYSFVIPGLLAGCAAPSSIEDANQIIRDGHRIVVDLREGEHATYPEAFASALREAGVKMIQIPVEDFAAPSMEQLILFCKHMESLLTMTSSSPPSIQPDALPPSSILVHCRAGIGRTGTVLGAALAYAVLRLGNVSRACSDARNEVLVLKSSTIAPVVAPDVVHAADDEGKTSVHMIDAPLLVQYLRSKRDQALDVAVQRRVFEEFVECLIDGSI